jgi:hypothetical protein
MKCGHVYAERSITGPDFMVERARFREGSKMCAYCGGIVMWGSQDEDDDELSALQEMARVTLWDKIRLIVVLGFLLAIGIAVLGQYLWWWKVWERLH